MRSEHRESCYIDRYVPSSKVAYAFALMTV